MSVKVTIDDVISCGHCVSGAKKWFSDYSLDFRSFLESGIDAEDMLATGDAYGQQVVEAAVKRQEVVLV